MYAGTEEFFKTYQSRAGAEGVDPLGYYLGGWGYAYIQVLGDAIAGTKSIDDNKIADYIKANTFKTIMGDVKFGENGEWATSRMLQVQYHDLKKDSGLDAFRGMDTQTVLTPGQSQDRQRDLSLREGEVARPARLSIQTPRGITARRFSLRFSDDTSLLAAYPASSTYTPRYSFRIRSLLLSSSADFPSNTILPWTMT